MRQRSKGGRRQYTVSTAGRRRFLKATATDAAATWVGSWPWQALMAQQGAVPGQDGWAAGQVRHNLPGVSDTGMLIKTSFARPLSDPPELRLQ